jgi:hypothetical protein
MRLAPSRIGGIDRGTLLALGAHQRDGSQDSQRNNLHFESSSGLEFRRQSNCAMFACLAASTHASSELNGS